MADTTTYSGQLTVNASGNVAFGGDKSGTQTASVSNTIALAAAGGTAPTISGFMKGTATVASAGDILLAHATDPLGGMGDASYSAGFTVAGSKLKTLYIKNTGAANCAIARKTTNGLPIFDAADDAITLAPGDIFLFHKKAGTAALTTGTNDALTLTPAASTTLEVFAQYGP